MGPARGPTDRGGRAGSPQGPGPHGAGVSIPRACPAHGRPSAFAECQEQEERPGTAGDVGIIWRPGVSVSPPGRGRWGGGLGCWLPPESLPLGQIITPALPSAFIWAPRPSLGRTRRGRTGDRLGRSLHGGHGQAGWPRAGAEAWLCCVTWDSRYLSLSLGFPSWTAMGVRASRGLSCPSYICWSLVGHLMGAVLGTGDPVVTEMPTLPGLPEQRRAAVRHRNKGPGGCAEQRTAVLGDALPGEGRHRARKGPGEMVTQTPQNYRLKDVPVCPGRSGLEAAPRSLYFARELAGHTGNCAAG